MALSSTFVVVTHSSDAMVNNYRDNFIKCGPIGSIADQVIANFKEIQGFPETLVQLIDPTTDMSTN